MPIIDTVCKNIFKKYLTLMAIDAQKAFDILKWSYLFKILEIYDFPTIFIDIIKKRFINRLKHKYTQT